MKAYASTADFPIAPEPAPDLGPRGLRTHEKIMFSGPGWTVKRQLVRHRFIPRARSLVSEVFRMVTLPSVG